MKHVTLYRRARSSPRPFQRSPMYIVCNCERDLGLLKKQAKTHTNWCFTHPPSPSSHSQLSLKHLIDWINHRALQPWMFIYASIRARQYFGKGNTLVATSDMPVYCIYNEMQIHFIQRFYCFYMLMLQRDKHVVNVDVGVKLRETWCSPAWLAHTLHVGELQAVNTLGAGPRYYNISGV